MSGDKAISAVPAEFEEEGLKEDCVSGADSAFLKKNATRSQSPVRPRSSRCGGNTASLRPTQEKCIAKGGGAGVKKGGARGGRRGSAGVQKVCIICEANPVSGNDPFCKTDKREYEGLKNDADAQGRQEVFQQARTDKVLFKQILEDYREMCQPVRSGGGWSRPPYNFSHV